MYFLKQVFEAITWNTKDFNIDRTGLININFENISSETKYTDRPIRKKHFLKKRNKVLEIITSRTGIIPYGKIVPRDSFDLKPENFLFFFLKKEKFIANFNKNLYQVKDMKVHSIPYKTLKANNLNDINDLYNAQDTILLCAINENRFQLMYDKYGFNHRKCDSASTLSASTERDILKVMFTLLKSNELVKVFEKTLTGDFTYVNTRLGFDAELLLSNANNIFADGDVNLQKDNDYKIYYIKLN